MLHYLEKIKKLSELEKNILIVATKEFEEKSYHLSNVDDIAQKLKIGKGTIYRHFGNKQDLFFYCLTYRFAERFQSLALVDTFDCPYDAMNFSLDISLESIENMQEKEGSNDLLTQAPQVASNKEDLVEYMMTLLERSIDKVKLLMDKCVLKAGKTNIETEIISEYIVSTIGAFVHMHHSCDRRKKQGNIKQLVNKFDSIKRFIFRGIGIDDKEIDKVLAKSNKKIKAEN